MKFREKIAVCSIALAALAVLAISGPANANILTNGNFATGDFTGWSASGDVNVIPETAYIACCGTLNATPGAYVASFGAGNLPDNGVISQSFATTSGDQYALAFNYGAVAAPIVQQLYVSVVTGPVTYYTTLTASGLNDFDTLFTSYNYVFTADAANSTLSFQDVSTITDNVDGLLENVSVNQTTVPEPITLSLFGAGLAGAAAMRRRKKKIA